MSKKKITEPLSIHEMFLIINRITRFLVNRPNKLYTIDYIFKKFKLRTKQQTYNIMSNVMISNKKIKKYKFGFKTLYCYDKELI